MTPSQSKLGDYVLPVRNGNPISLLGESDFLYLDISSVDRELRAIVNPQVVPANQAPSRAKQETAANDVIVSTVRPNLNTVAVVTNKHAGAIASTGFCVLRAKPGKLDARYLFHWISSEATVKQLVGLATGATYPAVSDKTIKSLSFAPPSFCEQQRISAILDQADSIRRKRQNAIHLADEFLRATFIDMFGDPISNEKGLPVRLLGDVCRFYAGNSLPNGEPFDGQTGGFLHIKVGDMNLPGNEVDINIAREWSSRGIASIIAPAGSILIPKRGGAIATNKKRVLSRPCALDPNLMAIEPGEKLRQEVLLEWFKQFDLSSIASGSAVPQLNKGDLAPLNITVPPLELQDKFVKIAKKVKSMLARQGDQLVLIQSASAALSFTLLDYGAEND